MTLQLTGLTTAAKAWKLAEYHNQHQKLLVILPDNREIEALWQDLKFFSSDRQVIFFPQWDTLPFEQVSPALSISSQRIKALRELSTHQRWITVLSAETLAQKILPPTELLQLQLHLTTGQEIPREQFLLRLELCGFERRSRVQAPGDMAVRGEVVDLFASTNTLPLRIEFFDDEIERLRLFSPETQRTVSQIDSFHILPVRENISCALHPDYSERLKNGLLQLDSRAKDIGIPLRKIKELRQRIVEGKNFPGCENLASLMFELVPVDSLWQDSDVTVVSDDPVRCISKVEQFYEEVKSRAARYRQEQNFLVPEKSLYRASTFINSYLDSQTLEKQALEFQEQEATTPIIPNHELSYALAHRGSQDGYKPLQEFILKRIDEQHKIAIVLPTTSRIQQIERILGEMDLGATLFRGSFEEFLELPRTRSKLYILPGSITHGFQSDEDKLTIIAEQDIFTYKSTRSAKARVSPAKILSTLNQLSPGDLIVHIDYGIGRYKGLEHRVLNGVEGDFLEIEYADSALLLPVQMIGKISSYASPTDKEPKLDKLSSTRWAQAKKKVREAVSALAGDLIKLYATRSIARGWRFEPWGAEDERFSESFPYDETEDQLKAINDTLADMASENPMDRLVCGDVGFGKTEVAIRAAFKATQHLKQVVVLTPTTVLAEQHANSFRERFKGYQVEIGVVSRFYSNRQNKETLQKLAAGDIDIIIGTHRLLSRDIKFHDLGLLIIDEEHRFGVKQKEKLKSLKSQIDVLTLTATPIPRTLHMSLIGVRDVSIIATPPPRRQAIKTYVARISEATIKDAILRETKRGGQVFFLYNRVQSIAMIVEQVKDLVPDARVEFAHGQMKETDLEDIMRRFIKHEIDVLVCTTIVESGIDVPNANTMIIYEAQNYGLAQLYQLRGRVGRGSRQAYAYFLTPPPQKLTSVARERLGVFASMDGLGLGFQLAMRDLEIRGSGSLLGKEQSGHVCSVGFDLYTKILKEAIEHLKGDVSASIESIDPEVNLGVVAFIPGYYIPDVSERLIMYQRLAGMWSEEEARELREEIEDRFGPLPEQVETLVKVMRIRSLLRANGVLSIERKGQSHIFLQLSANAPFDIQEILKLKEQGIEFAKNLTLKCRNWIPENSEPDLEELFERVEALLLRIRAGIN